MFCNLVFQLNNFFYVNTNKQIHLTFFYYCHIFWHPLAQPNWHKINCHIYLFLCGLLFCLLLRICNASTLTHVEVVYFPIEFNFLNMSQFINFTVDEHLDCLMYLLFEQSYRHFLHASWCICKRVFKVYLQGKMLSYKVCIEPTYYVMPNCAFSNKCWYLVGYIIPTYSSELSWLFLILCFSTYYLDLACQVPQNLSFFSFTASS